MHRRGGEGLETATVLDDGGLRGAGSPPGKGAGDVESVRGGDGGGSVVLAGHSVCEWYASEVRCLEETNEIRVSSKFIKSRFTKVIHHLRLHSPSLNLPFTLPSIRTLVPPVVSTARFGSDPYMRGTSLRKRSENRDTLLLLTFGREQKPIQGISRRPRCVHLLCVCQIQRASR